MLKFLDINKQYSILLLHGFSVGAYLWSEALVQIARDTTRYEHVTSKVVGQIWDSAVDPAQVPTGFGMALFPRNPAMQSIAKLYMK